MSSSGSYLEGRLGNLDNCAANFQPNVNQQVNAVTKQNCQGSRAMMEPHRRLGKVTSAAKARSGCRRACASGLLVGSF